MTRLGSCVNYDPEIWFSDRRHIQDLARQICRECPIQLKCLRDTLAIDPLPSYGIWAGLSNKQLRTYAARQDRMRRIR